MRVDSKGNIEGIYEKTMKKDLAVSENKLKNEKKEGVLDQDRIDISENAGRCDEFSSIRNKVVDDIEKATSPDKLRQIKAAIENGTYHVSGEDIAGAILKSNN